MTKLTGKMLKGYGYIFNDWTVDKYHISQKALTAGKINYYYCEDGIWELNEYGLYLNNKFHPKRVFTLIKTEEDLNKAYFDYKGEKQ